MHTLTFFPSTRVRVIGRYLVVKINQNMKTMDFNKTYAQSYTGTYVTKHKYVKITGDLIS